MSRTFDFGSEKMKRSGTIVLLFLGVLFYGSLGAESKNKLGEKEFQMKERIYSDSESAAYPITPEIFVGDLKDIKVR
ncbi:hypothetical protein [Leptospira adleri]|uniref:hypothetical protein n=1 Tax=Leptospira adleri TaxID=2023186 RepID=UPI00108478B8|nr:hypothetical protein [Leptospira adleri]TGM61557.1 hypothetical protein EHQ97_00930 [Leptospira adleri]